MPFRKQGFTEHDIIRRAAAGGRNDAEDARADVGFLQVRIVFFVRLLAICCCCHKAGMKRGRNKTKPLSSVGEAQSHKLTAHCSYGESRNSGISEATYATVQYGTASIEPEWATFRVVSILWLICLLLG